MTLDANALKTAMLSATLNDLSAETALSDLGNAIALYLLNNTVLTFTWVDPSGTYTAIGAIISLTITLTPSLGIVYGAGHDFIRDQIQAGLTADLFNITDPGYSTSPASMIDAPAFDLRIGTTTSRDDAFFDLASRIVNQFKAYQPGQPISGARGTESGSTTLCIIS